MNEWNETILSEVLVDKGYIRGPFGSALKRGDMKEDGIPVYEQQHAIYNSREFRYYIDEQNHIVGAINYIGIDTNFNSSEFINLMEIGFSEIIDAYNKIKNLI